MKHKLFLIVLSVAAICTIGIVWRQGRSRDAVDSELARVGELSYQVQSLVGVKGVWVLVDYLDEDAMSTGVTEDQFKQDVESELRLAGIKVNSREERSAFKDGAYLHVDINTVTYNDSPNIAFSVSIELSQPVGLRTGLSMSVRGITWHDRSMGMCPGSAFAERVRQDVKAGVDLFIDEYFIANPEK